MHTLPLHSERARARAMQTVKAAPLGYVVIVRQPSRTNDQNAKMWAMLTDISHAMPEGRKFTPDVWKAIFMHGLGHEQQFAMALDDSGPFPLGFRTSKLSVPQMADLITFIQEYGDRHGVEWSDGLDQQNAT